MNPANLDLIHPLVLVAGIVLAVELLERSAKVRIAHWRNRLHFLSAIAIILAWFGLVSSMTIAWFPDGAVPTIAWSIVMTSLFVGLGVDIAISIVGFIRRQETREEELHSEYTALNR